MKCNICNHVIECPQCRRLKTKYFKQEYWLRVKRFRAKRNFTIEQMAKHIGVHKRQVIRWENKVNVPSPMAIEVLLAKGV